ncbi:MAG: hypothetical protein IKS79_00625 [Bacteroidales bacterium]|nr:hypothetical protein [Bacteroidales bacterium]
MKKRFILLTVILAFAALFTSCQKSELNTSEEEVVDGIPEGAFLLSTEGNESGTKVIVSGTTVNWTEGDVVNINGNDYPIKLSGGKFYIEPGADGTPLIAGDTIRGYYHCGEVKNPQSMNPRVYYPEEYLTEISKDKQKISLPMVAFDKTGNHVIEFKNLTAALLLTIKNNTGFPVKLEEVILSSNNCDLGGSQPINFNNSADGWVYAADSKNSSVKLSIFASSQSKYEIPIGDSITVQVPFRRIINANINILVRANSNLGAVKGFHGANQDSDDIYGVLNPNYEFRYSYTPPTSLTLARNKMIKASVTIKRAAESAGRVTEVDHGRFSISATETVHFSKGNLCYKATASVGEKWHFAANQYDYIGAANNNIASNYNGDIDLFGWATSGHDNGQTSYQPYSSSDISSTYYNRDTTWWNTSSNWPNSIDWGYNLSRVIGSYRIAWRTLSRDEWLYLLTRNDSKYFGYGTVAGKHGVFFLPDDWVQPAFAPKMNPQNREHNNYTAKEWALMAKAGAIFLPYAGRRAETTVSNVDKQGNYWTSTYDQNIKAINFQFGETNTFVSDYIKYGYSVRLVSHIYPMP